MSASRYEPARRDLTDHGIARDRAAAQRLSAPGGATPADVLGWLGAVQAQDYPLAKWSVAQRLSKSTAEVDNAIADGTILRAHVMRPTWHFVARDDLRWMQALTAPRVLALMDHYDRRHGIDAALIVRATKTIVAAITRDGHLTRGGVADALSGGGITTTPWLVGQLLIHAELRAVVCSGTPNGRHQTYALVDERAPRASDMSRDEALATLARRYFQSHGPATARDYQWWSGLSAPDVARGIEMLGGAVERVRSGDRTYVVATFRTASRARSPSAQVLQPFDEFLVGYSESRGVVDVSGAARAGASGGAGLLTRAVVYDGQLVARWRIAPVRGTRGVTIDPLRRLSSVERDAVAVAATRFERFYFA